MRTVNHELQKESLRERLMDEIYAGAFAGGFPAMLLDEDVIQECDEDELPEIAQMLDLPLF